MNKYFFLLIIKEEIVLNIDKIFILYNLFEQNYHNLGGEDIQNYLNLFC